MSDFEWRTWLFQELSTDPGVQSIVGNRIYGAGSVTGKVKVKPFLIITLDPETPAPFPGASTQGALVWAHDEPGDYLRIGMALRAVRSALVGQVAMPGAIGCRWLGDSQDLTDEPLGTISRYSTFSLTGKEGNP